MNMFASMPSTEPEMQVAAGILTDAQGRVLIGQRTYPPQYRHQWEFPGGKLESGETPAQALGRELAEELGVAVQASEPLIHIRYRYPDRYVHLHVRRVTQFSGKPNSLEGQALRWVRPEQLDQFPMLAANRKVIAALTLPTVYAISDIQRYPPEIVLKRLPELLAEHPLALQIREKQLTETECGALTRKLLPFCHKTGIKVLGNMAPEQAMALDLDGVHLSSARLGALNDRPLPADRWVAASCHNPAELTQAGRIGADFAVLSPVRPTPGHPDAVALGWERFAELSELAELPVYALGGVALDDLATVRQCGGQGVAMIRGAWEG